MRRSIQSLMFLVGLMLVAGSVVAFDISQAPPEHAATRTQSPASLPG